MTITEQLEGLLPADGVYTKDQRIIAEAVGELRQYHVDTTELVRERDAESHEAAIYITLYKSCLDTIRQQDAALASASDSLKQSIWYVALAFAAGCIASAIYVVLV